MLAALDISRLTSLNESGVMWERGIFGLLQWGFLTPEARSGRRRDIAQSLANGNVSAVVGRSPSASSA